MTEYMTILSTFFAGASAVAAAFAIIAQSRAQNSKDVLDQAVLALERAYNSLTQDWVHGTPVLADRLNWLTCARHIESYKTLKKRLTRKLNIDICEEHEEYWRHRFYLCLNKPGIHSPEYYAENGNEGRAGIEPRSALIVHSFATWPRIKADPIERVDIDHLVQESNPLNANIGLRFYVGAFPHLRHLTDGH